MRIAMIGLGLVAVCGMTAGADAKHRMAKSVMAELYTPEGADVGHAMVTEVKGGLKVTVTAKNMPAGVHGAHIHTTGLCEAPGFTSAGGHWNPTAMHHGSMNRQGPHEGDLPNLTIGADGTGMLSYVVKGAMLSGLQDADGAALVIHAGPDDLMTDPSGNSGGRIACGVLK